MNITHLCYEVSEFEEFFFPLWPIICKWETNQSSISLMLQPYRTCCFHSLPVQRDEESKDIEKEKFNVKSSKHEYFQHMESLWQSVFATPYKWYDCRMNKKNQEAPDFKHIETGEVLWVESHGSPDWVNSKLSTLGKEAFSAFLPVKELWKSFFADTSKWFDHRKTKKSKKHPDFVNKNTREALWINNTQNPTWVISMLENIQGEAFMTSPTIDNLWKSWIADPSKWFDNRKTKKGSTHPDFVHKDTLEGLWIEDKKNPTWIIPMLSKLQDETFAPSLSLENLWKSFFAGPSKWHDYRKNKKYNNFPDFKHKENGESLWIDNPGTPAWVLPKLNDLQDEAFASSASVEDLWVSLFVDQSKWIDYRKNKKSNNHPDFVHKDTLGALWMEAADTPDWVTAMLRNLQNEAFAPSRSKEIVWKVLFADPSKWFDHRPTKKGNNYPDFTHIDAQERLWIADKRTPAWVLPKLNTLQHDVFAPPDKVLICYEIKWRALFSSPSEWFDNRTSKKYPNAPDFRHRKTKEGLWINSKSTPDWVMTNLRKLGDEALPDCIAKGG